MLKDDFIKSKYRKWFLTKEETINQLCKLYFTKK